MYMPVMQESIYVKLLRNSVTMPTELDHIRRNVPNHGTICALYLSLNDFRGLMTLQGEAFDISRFADDIVVV